MNQRGRPVAEVTTFRPESVDAVGAIQTEPESIPCLMERANAGDASQSIHGPCEFEVKSANDAEKERGVGTFVQAEICERDEIDSAEVNPECLHRAGAGEFAERRGVYFDLKRGRDQSGDVVNQGFGAVTVANLVRDPILLGGVGVMR